MKKPNLKEEKKLWKKGYKWVACLDEAGRGALAGPVVAAAVVINPPSKIWWGAKLYFKIQNLKDSKKLTPKARERLYKILINHPQIEWGIGTASERVIDKINILEATKLAMVKAIHNLVRKLEKRSDKLHHGVNITTLDFLLLDGRMKLDLSIPQKSIIKADEKVFSCLSASIIAKVVRDRIMKQYHKKYPQYGFDKHKGYPTKFHLKMLKKYRPSKIHRKSFKPVRRIIAKF